MKPRLAVALLLAATAISACGGSSPPKPSAATIKETCLHEVSLIKQVVTQITALKAAAASGNYPPVAADLRKAVSLVDAIADTAEPLHLSGVAKVRTFANDMRAFAHQVSAFNVTGMAQAERKLQNDDKTLSELPGGKYCASYKHLVPALDTP